MTTNEAFAVEFGRFLDRAGVIAKPEKLFGLVGAFAQNLDWPVIEYRSLAHNQKSLRPLRRAPAFMLNYPHDWRQRYFEMGYDKTDPLVKTSCKRIGAFRWTDVYNAPSTTDDERRFFDDAATFGLKSGISVPLHRPDGGLAVMSFANRYDREIQNKTITYLELAAIHFHLRIAEITKSSSPKGQCILTRREKECISWVARGKTSWEIGKILIISSNTVNFHLKNVMRKLDVDSRTVAAIEACRAGIIEL